MIQQYYNQSGGTMHTPYDCNYWMCQNTRVEHGKNESRPIFTESYKQVGGMRGPNDLYNYAPPENNIPRPRHKVPNEQPRMGNYQNMWPSSVYSLPFRSQQPQNFHSPDIFPAHATNMYDPSQSLQNQNLQHVQNSNCLSKMPNVNYKNTVGVVNNQQSSQNAKVPRLRVKDVSSLNNNYIASNPMMESHLVPQQKKQSYYPYTSTAPVEHTNDVYNKETQREIVNYERNAVNQSYQHYGPQTNHMTPVSNDQQYVQVPHPIYEQNAGYTRENQYQFNSGQQIDQHSSETFNRTSYHGLPVQMTSNKNIHMSEVHNSQAIPPNMQNGNERVGSQFRRNSFESNVSVGTEMNPYGKVNPNKSNAITLLDLIDSSKISTVSQFESQKQLTPPAAPQGPRFSPVTPPNQPVTESVTNIPVSGQNISTVQITIPHSGESTVISLVNSSFVEPGKNSSSSVVKSSGESVSNPRRNDAPQVSATKLSIATSCQNCLESPRAGHTCKTPNRSTTNLDSSQQQLESTVDNRINEETVTPNFISDTCKQSSIKETTASQNVTKIRDCLVAPKEEMDSLNNETPVIKIEDDSAVEDNVKKQTEQIEQIEQTEQIEQVEQIEQIEKVVQTEKATDESPLPNSEPPSKENEEIDISNSDVDCVSPDNSDSDSKLSEDMTNDKNRSQETETQTDTKSNDEDNESDDDGEEKCQKVVKLKDKFQSKINRSKLNMLINFLEKEQKPVSTRKHSAKKESKEKKNKSKRNGRKVNKKKKEEIISSVSSKTSKSVSNVYDNDNDNVNDNDNENGRNSDETKEKVNGCANSEPENCNFSENKDNSERHSDNNFDSIESKDKKLEPSNISSNDKKSITSEETNIINIMRAFQNLKNHFCANCDLSSPVGSIWINVLSGELRCLNCFKKMMSKPEENASNSRKNTDDVNISKSESNTKSTEGLKKGSYHEMKIDNKINSDLTHPSIKHGFISNTENGNDKNCLGVRVKKEIVETQNNEENTTKDAMDLTGILKRRASDAEISLHRGKLSEEPKRVKSVEIMERTTKSNSHLVSSSKHSVSKDDLRRERNSLDSKTAKKEHKESKRRASEELMRPELKHKDEKSSKEDGIKKENRKRSNSTPLPSLPHKHRILVEPTKEYKKGDEELAKQNKKKDFQSQKDYDEHLKKEKKLIDFLDHQSKKITSTIKSCHDQTKPKERDSAEVHKKKITFKENSSKRQNEEQYSSSKYIKKESDQEKGKTTHSERKEKSLKISHSKEESQEKKEEHNKHKKLTERHEDIIKSYKEKQMIKPKEKHSDKDSHKSYEHRKEHRDKKEKKEKIEEDVLKRKIKSEEKKRVDEKRIEKSQKEKKIGEEKLFLPQKKSDKAVECSFEEILRQMDNVQRLGKVTKKKTESGSLLDKLYKKTKELSLSLLNDAPQ